MNINHFAQRNKFLYHLTDRRNITTIKRDGSLLSTETIVNLSILTAGEKNIVLTHRRPMHRCLSINGQKYFIRDQRPITEKNLQKCLTHGLTVNDYLLLLNMRVFFWPNLNRLCSHYKRYESENPIIIKVPTIEILELNAHAEFCRLNSGATRSNSHLNGAPPERGLETFLPANLYNLPIGSVAEVTFPHSCILPKTLLIGDTPSGPWENIDI